MRLARLVEMSNKIEKKRDLAIAGKHLPKDAKTGGAVAPLLLAVAAVSEQLAKEMLSDEAMLAEDCDGQKCVLKFVRLEGLIQEQCHQALQEVAILRSLSHPNVLRIQTAFLHHFTLVVSSEFCDAGDLQVLVSKRRELRDQDDFLMRPTRCCKAGFSEASVKGMFVQMVSALDYIHSSGILHRDLKSSNIFLTERGVVKVGDFGVSECGQSDESGAAKTTPRVVGSIHYLAPELCEGGRPTAAADCWALGVVLYEMCALEVPFPGNTPLVVAMKILQGVVQPLSENYSVELRSLCGALLCPSVKHRISAAEVAMLPWLRELQKHAMLAPEPDHLDALKSSAGATEFERFIMAQLAARVKDDIRCGQ
eukprot:symbB.v1.2.031734.t2/scaffold3717.1/size51512/4